MLFRCVLSLRGLEDGADETVRVRRIGGVAAAVSCWVCWKMTRERERDRVRRLRTGSVG